MRQFGHESPRHKDTKTQRHRHASIHANMHTFIHAYIHAYIYIHIHTHTHTHIFWACNTEPMKGTPFHTPQSILVREHRKHVQNCWNNLFRKNALRDCIRVRWFILFYHRVLSITCVVMIAWAREVSFVLPWCQRVILKRPQVSQLWCCFQTPGVKHTF